MAKDRRRDELSESAKSSWIDKTLIRVLAVTHVVCPLLFFTNLTRNPYYTQIALLNIFISIVGLLWVIRSIQKNTWRAPAPFLKWPFIGLIAVFAISTMVTFLSQPIFQTGIAFEGTRVWVFTIGNCLWAFCLPILIVKPLKNGNRELNIWTDIVLATIWGLLWFGFHSFRPDPNQILWDSYGGFLWALAILYAVVRVKKGEAMEFFHLIFAVSVLASLYGILQYMGRDMIWSSPVQPYGGRPVSSFGNPNFLSSYLLLVCPLAGAMAMTATNEKKWGYAVVSFICALGIICTLTRSTYVGLFSAFLFLGIFIRPSLKKIDKRWWMAGAAFVLVVALFPGTPVSQIQSPLKRFTEIFTALQAGESYGPWHQRLLIWSSSWDMVSERPFLGKGWGLFELFYPFYQGKYLFHELFVKWRTHANNAHNIVMEIWAQTGTLGLGMSLWLFVTILWGGIKLIGRKTTAMGTYLTAGLLAGWVGMVVDNFFGNVSIFFAMPAFLFWWNIGSLFNESDAPVYKDFSPLSSFLSKSIGIGCVAVFVGIGAYFIFRWNGEVNYFKGFKLAKQNQVVPSIKFLEKSYEWFPGEVNNNYELGNSYARYTKELSDKGYKADADRIRKKAIHGFQSALKANPGYDEIYYNLGVVLLQDGQEEEAVENLEMAIFINPLLHGAYGTLGNLYFRENKFEKALAMYEQAVEAFPRDSDFWNNYGFVLDNAGKKEEALNAYKNAYALNPGSEQIWTNLYTISSSLGRKEPFLEGRRMLDELNKAVEQQNYQKGVQVAEKLAAMFPINHQIHHSYGTVLFFAQQPQKSLSAFETAIKIKPDFYDARLNWGKVQQSLGEFEKARQAYESILSEDPAHAEAKKALASIPKK